MTEATVRRVPEDRVGARDFLVQARIFMGDADVETLSNEGRQLLLHQTAICACDAVLLACGMQITGVDGAHLLRLERALEQLPDDVDELLDALDASRARRVEASYRAGPVPQASVHEAHEATLELLAHAERFVG
jgi:hypothetical protein